MTPAPTPTQRSKATYPTDLLPQSRSALLLFCAGFHGRNDGIWIHTAGITDVTGVDHDATRIAETQEIYPGWKLLTADVYQWTRDPAPRRTWDTVSVDPQTNQADQCLAWLPEWCNLANQTVILGVMEPQVTQHQLYRLSYPHTPDGWYIDRVTRRNDIAHWLVARRNTTGPHTSVPRAATPPPSATIPSADMPPSMGD